jgi:preprotein translocase subunit SecD
MKRQLTLFLLSLILISVFTLGYHPRALADWLLLSPTVVDDASVKIKLTPEQSANLSRVTLEASPAHLQEVITLRLAQLKLKSYEVQAAGEGVEVILPDHENMAYIINIISRVGEVEFINGGQRTPPLGEKVEIGAETGSAQHVYPLLFSGREIREIAPPNPESGEIFYQISLQPEAAQRVADFAEAKEGYICLAIDGEVINCSTMYHWSGTMIKILPDLGSGAGLSLADLAVFLDSGPLPAPLRVITN